MLLHTRRLREKEKKEQRALSFPRHAVDGELAGPKKQSPGLFGRTWPLDPTTEGHDGVENATKERDLGRVAPGTWTEQRRTDEGARNTL